MAVAAALLVNLPAELRAQSQLEVTWQTIAVDYRGQLGKAFNVFCPPGGTAATVWGVGIYTDDSSICTSAVHALATFDVARGGTVYFSMEPGQEGYDADRRRGVATSAWTTFWDGGFRIIAGVPGKREREIDARTPMEITWSTTARHLRGGASTSRVMLCPRNGDAQPVWGSDVYTDDSSICAAAVHMGLITRAAGGGVTVRTEAGREEYAGATRNGVTSLPWERWEGSFGFPRGQIVVALPDAPVVAESPEPLERVSLPVPAPPRAEGLAVGPAGEFLVDWSTSATQWREKSGGLIAVDCPAGGSASTVWGSGTYTDDSSVCTAAVHALATFDFARGGAVQIELARGQSSYPSDVRRGVETQEWGQWEASFRVISGVPGMRTRQIVDSTTTEVSWSTTAEHLRGKAGVRRVICPRDGRPTSVWGSDAYSAHSSVCGAAVHAGVITRSEGGLVSIRLDAGRRSFTGAARNGITTQSLPSWEGSFTFIR
jgi:hypothetical protein